MRTRLLQVLAASALLLGPATGPAWGQGTKGNPQDEAALLKKAESFVDAFHKGDAKAIAAHWTADGDYTAQNGRLLTGRAAIEKAFTEYFEEHKGMKLRIDIKGLRFVTPDVAIEDGTTSVLPPDGGPPSRARYTIVHVKRDGEWLLSSVRDAPHVPPSQYEHLRGLEWAIGQWADENDKGESARVSFNWAEGQNFIVAEFTTTFKDVAIGGGTQWIAWDPVAKRIRSWTFESTGGFGEAAWEGKGNQWTAKSTAILRDGKKMVATLVITRLDADTFTWESHDRSLDGQALPDVKPVRMKRAK
jgi:uncharacterized protein (TIGR02246 family)